MKNLTGKKRISVSLIISLLTVFFTAMPMLTFGWFKQYMDVTSQTIQITSGESVAYIEIEIYSFHNNILNGPLAFHTSLNYEQDQNCTTVESTSEDDSGTFNVTFNDIILNKADISAGVGAFNNPDFFDPSGLPEFIIEFRIVKEIFESYIKSSVNVTSNTGTNYFYNSSGTKSSTTLAAPYKYRKSIFSNNATAPIDTCVKNNTTSNTSGDDTNLNILRNRLPNSMPTSETNLFADLDSLFNQGAPVEEGINYEDQLYVPQFNKKKPTSNDAIAYSKAILYNICLDPALILTTYQETNKSNYSENMTFDLEIEFSFELSNDPFK